MLNTRWRWHFAVFCHMHQIQHSIILWNHPAIKIRILFRVDERQLNHVLSYFLLTFLHLHILVASVAVVAPQNDALGHARKQKNHPVSGVGAWHVSLDQAGTWATATLGINKISA